MDLALGGHVRAKLLPSRLDPDPAVVRLSWGLTLWCLLSNCPPLPPGKRVDRPACSHTPVCASIPGRQLKTFATWICGAGEKSDEHQSEKNLASCNGFGLLDTWEQHGV